MVRPRDSEDLPHNWSNNDRVDNDQNYFNTANLSADLRLTAYSEGAHDHSYRLYNLSHFQQL